MYTPTATYRIQLSESFTLVQLDDILDYLHQLGISTVYASPIFQARPGSTHGYDVTDPLRISSDIGTEEQLERIAGRLQEQGMGWLQDIVPNHMAYDTVNPWVYDLWEKGRHSAYVGYFDVDWEHPDPRYHGKVMIPSLGDTLENVLAQQQLTLSFGDTGVQWAYYDHRFPLAVTAYPGLLRAWSAAETLGENKQVASLIDRFATYAANLTAGNVSQGDSWADLVADLSAAIPQQKGARATLQPWLDQYPQDTERMNSLLDEQNFRLVHWKTTESVINYRRFFTVNDLICLNVQYPAVFEHYHRLIRQWTQRNYMQGVRVDHIDGLLDPAGYLSALRALLGSQVYISVEKILEFDETLPRHWPIQGSSGYDFLADVSQLFTDPPGGQSLLTYYAAWNPDFTDYPSLVYRNKSYILYHRMQGELDNLMRRLEYLEVLPAEAVADQGEALKEALAHLLIAFPVYRIYSTAFPFASEDQAVLEQTFRRAQEQAPTLAPQFDQLRTVFSGEASPDEALDQRRLRFVMRCQQFAGPLAAKGVEDTTFYGYFPLISHNEVGDSPHHLGIDASTFHERMVHRSPRTMNATATHDTKRGEDARLRINTLTELPSEWMKETARWRYANEAYKSAIDDRGEWPEANFEYFIYQTMLGTYPFHATPEEEDYEARLKAFLLKAAREAKGHTSWSEPHEPYETSIDHFVTQLLQDQDFMDEFLRFAKPVALTAVTYSLGQTLLKATAPGIPDVYQGSEYWDLSMVDPDNRRPVDYAQRQEALARLDAPDATHRTQLLRQLTNNLLDPSIKLYVLWQTLQTRRQLDELFTEGSYQPLVVRGERQDHLLAFRRVWHDQEALVLVPLHIANLPLTGSLPLGDSCWKDTQVLLPETEKTQWQHAFTQQTISATDHLSVGDVLRDFPVALLTKNRL